MPIHFIVAALFLVLLGIAGSNLIVLARGRRLAAAAAAPSEGLPSVSVLVPARNEAQNLGRLLPSLLEQRYPAFEVVVVDDASEDETWAVLEAHRDPRLRPVRGEGPPPGWVGKVHALHQAVGHARNDLLLFLDADTELRDSDALGRLVARHRALPEPAVLTGFPALQGGGLLLVSMIPFSLLTGLPLALVPRHPSPKLSALNGQCWMITRALYDAYTPHARHADEVLEDVQIGRYLKSRGVTPYLLDLKDDLVVRMYPNLAAAWVGFRKNASLLLGGRPAAFAALLGGFVGLYVVAPLLTPVGLAGAYVLKGLSDRFARMPLWVTLLAPLSMLLSIVLALDSARVHATGRATWKGRVVA